MSDFSKEMAELTKTIEKINKQYGEGTVVDASRASALKYSRIRTGSFSLDVEIGGGLPENRITVLAGPYESTKTTIALKTVSNAQTKYPQRKVMWVDGEGALDLEWAKLQGVDLDRMMVVRPQYMEQALDIVDNMVRQAGVSLIVVDSMAALLPEREMEGSMEDQQMGLNAAITSKFMRKVTSSLWYNKLMTNEIENPCTVLLINQFRKKLGFGGGDTMPGGESMNHYPTVIVYFRAGGWIQKKMSGVERVVGREIKFRTEKNKTFPSKRSGVFSFYFQDTEEFKAGEFDRMTEILTYGVIWDEIVRKGAWYYLGEEGFHGKDALVDYLKNNSDEVDRLEKAIMKKVIEGDQQGEDNDDPGGSSG